MFQFISMNNSQSLRLKHARGSPLKHQQVPPHPPAPITRSMNCRQTLGAWLPFGLLNYAFATFPAPSANQPGAAPNPNTTQCQIYPTTLESWNELGVDTFLSTFPGGKDTALEDFTFINHITNFVCGLGENCLAGQVGHPSSP